MPHALLDKHRATLDGALDAFETRTHFIAAQGIEPERLSFATAFGRPLEDPLVEKLLVEA